MKSWVPLAELENRMIRFRERMDTFCSEWEMAALFSKINQYYFTGTMQDGVLIIPRQDKAVYWVRRSFNRAKDESTFSRIEPMQSFRNLADRLCRHPKKIHLETELVPLALLQCFQRYFPGLAIEGLDVQVAAVRAVKSSFELKLMEQAGRIHQRILEKRVPELLRAGGLPHRPNNDLSLQGDTRCRNMEGAGTMPRHREPGRRNAAARRTSLANLSHRHGRAPRPFP